MNISGITYQNMVEKLPEAIPELKSRYDKELEWLEEKDMAYSFYDCVLYRHIEALLKAPVEDKPQLKRIFAFVESLCAHPDSKVRDVVEDAVCEAICSDEVVLQKAQRYLGAATKKYCTSYMGNKLRPR